MIKQSHPADGFPRKLQVERPILQTLQGRGVSLAIMGDISLVLPNGLGVDAKGNFILSRIGMAFRRWCKKQRIETPPASWSLHLIGRGDSDSKNSYPVLDSNVKAAHTKPILFFLSESATEIYGHCGCS